MGKITTHVLDTARGRPAAEVPVALAWKEGDSWRLLAEAKTDADGRIGTFADLKVPLQAGIYRLQFQLQGYFKAQNTRSFYPEAQIIFNVENPAEHFHVPLLLSGFGYSTYRGS